MQPDESGNQVYLRNEICYILNVTYGVITTGHT